MKAASAYGGRRWADPRQTDAHRGNGPPIRIYETTAAQKAKQDARNRVAEGQREAELLDREARHKAKLQAEEEDALAKQLWWKAEQMEADRQAEALREAKAMEAARAEEERLYAQRIAAERQAEALRMAEQVQAEALRKAELERQDAVRKEEEARQEAERLEGLRMVEIRKQEAVQKETERQEALRREAERQQHLRREAEREAAKARYVLDPAIIAMYSGWTRLPRV